MKNSHFLIIMNLDLPIIIMPVMFLNFVVFQENQSMKKAFLQFHLFFIFQLEKNLIVLFVQLKYF